MGRTREFGKWKLWAWDMWVRYKRRRNWIKEAIEGNIEREREREREVGVCLWRGKKNKISINYECLVLFFNNSFSK